eukprot:4276-Heterococcus_DN1.PRE.1
MNSTSPVATIIHAVSPVSSSASASSVPTMSSSRPYGSVVTKIESTNMTTSSAALQIRLWNAGRRAPSGRAMMPTM